MHTRIRLNFGDQRLGHEVRGTFGHLACRISHVAPPSLPAEDGLMVRASVRLVGTVDGTPIREYWDVEGEAGEIEVCIDDATPMPHGVDQ